MFSNSMSEELFTASKGEINIFSIYIYHLYVSPILFHALISLLLSKQINKYTCTKDDYEIPVL